jgi:hypothetical protein
MSWLFSPALVEASLADHCWDGEQFAQLNVMPTAQPFWRNAKPMDASRFSRFGLTLLLLTADRGEALLTWFREVFLARTFPSPVQEMGLTVSAPASGVKWLALFARLNPVTSGWKTAQCSLLEDSTEFSQTFPNSGSMLNGDVWERPTLERHISASESGFLPTPVTLDTGSRFNRSQSHGAQPRPTLGAMARYDLWPTPTVKGNYNRKGASSTSGDGLATAVSRFPTPTVSMRKGSSIGALTRKDGRSRANDRLDYRVEGTGQTGRLNPQFVEWLMGWPIGWTALQPLAMDKFREWRRQHGVCFGTGDKPANPL